MSPSFQWMVGELRMNLRNFIDLEIIKSEPEEQKRKINGTKLSFPKCILMNTVSMNYHMHIETLTSNIYCSPHGYNDLLVIM